MSLKRHFTKLAMTAATLLTAGTGLAADSWLENASVKVAQCDGGEISVEVYVFTSLGESQPQGKGLIIVEGMSIDGDKVIYPATYAAQEDQSLAIQGPYESGLVVKQAEEYTTEFKTQFGLIPLTCSSKW